MKQIVIIGLGNFGATMARELSTKGKEVIAIDRDPARVQDLTDVVTQGIVADATDIDALQALSLEGAEMVIVAVGRSLSDSILITLNVKDLGVRRVCAKAMSEPHGRILEKLGAAEVFFPERDQALALARRILNPNMIDYIPFIEGYTIVELAAPRELIGKRLREADLINQYGVQVVAVKDVIKDQVNIIPTGDYLVTDSDLLILLGPKESIERFREKT